MLEQVDIAVVVKAHHDNALILHSDNEVIHTEAYGPAGWQTAINMLLDRLGIAVAYDA
jgi:predicted mannosyl-3-phosphoglycerate phosphatase (HAD superfamily)